MPFNFTPLDWYWSVGGSGPHLDDEGNYTGDTSQVYSSKRNTYVPSDDAEFIAWRDAKRAEWGAPEAYAVTLIDTEANLADVLAIYGITPAFAR